MKKIVWDWNGTLFDDVDLCLYCINTLLNRYKLPVLPDLEAYRNVFEFPVQAYYKKIGFDFDKTPFSVLAKQYMDLYQDRSYSCSLVEDAHRAIENAKAQSIHQTILSASRMDYLRHQMKVCNMDLIDSVYGIQDIYARSKIDLAKQYEKTLSPGDEVWFVGDSLHDFEVASSIHANCILVTTGHQSKERLKSAGVPVVDSLEQSLEVIYAGN